MTIIVYSDSGNSSWDPSTFLFVLRQMGLQRFISRLSKAYFEFTFMCLHTTLRGEAVYCKKKCLLSICLPLAYIFLIGISSSFPPSFKFCCCTYFIFIVRSLGLCLQDNLEFTIRITFCQWVQQQGGDAKDYISLEIYELLFSTTRDVLCHNPTFF